MQETTYIHVIEVAGASERRIDVGPVDVRHDTVPLVLDVIRRAPAIRDGGHPSAREVNRPLARGEEYGTAGCVQRVAHDWVTALWSSNDALVAAVAASQGRGGENRKHEASSLSVQTGNWLHTLVFKHCMTCERAGAWCTPATHPVLTHSRRPRLHKSQHPATRSQTIRDGLRGDIVARTRQRRRSGALTSTCLG